MKINYESLVKKNDVNEIAEKRKKLIDMFKRKSINVIGDNFVNISPLDVKLFFYLYDEVFFEGFFKKNEIHVEFSVSDRMTSAAGKTIAKGLRGKPLSKFEIRMSKIFFKNFKKMGEERKVCGISCKNEIDSIALVMEHEMVHIIEFMMFRESNCSGARFKSMANMNFGHMGSYHQLPNNREVLKREKDMKLGDIVSFKYKGTMQQGILYKINKRAVIMVKTKGGAYADKMGNTYEKFYVPLEKLKKEI